VLAFINCQLFNQLLLRPECCSASNARFSLRGLKLLDTWIVAESEQVVPRSVTPRTPPTTQLPFNSFPLSRGSSLNPPTGAGVGASAGQSRRASEASGGALVEPSHGEGPAAGQGANAQGSDGGHSNTGGTGGGGGVERSYSGMERTSSIGVERSSCSSGSAALDPRFLGQGRHHEVAEHPEEEGDLGRGPWKALGHVRQVSEE
jgi:hypothetical protein